MPTINPYSAPDSAETTSVEPQSRLGWGFVLACVLTFLLIFTFPIGFKVYARAWIATLMGAVCLATVLMTVRGRGWGCALPLLIVTLMVVATAWSMTPAWHDIFGFGLINEYDAR